MRLDEISTGASHTVHMIHGSGGIPQRLMELGVIAGSVVKVLGRAPFGGTLRVRVGAGQLALRSDEARLIEVLRK
ncbi:MAG: ferrous iron transport protein A [Phycisphaerae bacterium]